MDLTRPEQVFVRDMMYKNLSLVTDAYSRKIMGNKLSDNMNMQKMLCKP